MNLYAEAETTIEIFQDALEECYEHNLNPNVLFTTALQTVLFAMFESAKDKNNAAEAAQHCITAALMLSDGTRVKH